MPEHIFREYDIRGIVDEDLTDEGMKAIGSAVATTLTRDGITRAVVGRDIRLSSGRFFEAVAAGLNGGGVDVVDIGEVPTPVFYFAAKRWNIKGGVMITASHNPSEFNGLKVLHGEGTIYGAEIRKLREIAIASAGVRGSGTVERRDANGEYIEHICGDIKLARHVRFAADGGNGTAGLVVPDLVKRLECDPVYLYMEPDGNYPNHHPDPTVETNLADLKKTVIEQGLELGVGFDGDTDRLGVIDDRGGILWGDRLLALFARSVLAENPGATVIFEVKCSEGLEEDILRHGGQPVMWKTGHSLIKKKMRDEGALLAGEMSGHLFFADRYYGYDDAIYAACRLLEIVSLNERPLSELLTDMTPYVSTPEIRIDCDDTVKFDIVEKVAEHFKKRYEVIDIDGARVKFGDGWGLIRASNTQPVLVLRFEARTDKALLAIKQEMADVLSRYTDVSSMLQG
ncbi:MAG: phosphomannomutase/phosphoglucomutase [bacterium]|nr:MAG: phosphomannomutase/phosphoglucomutase [bacterium]